MKQLTLEYTVSDLTTKGSIIEMTLTAQTKTPTAPPMEEVTESMPSEEEVKRMLEKIKPNSTGSDEEIVVGKFVDAYVKEIKEKMPRLFEELAGAPYGGGRMAVPVPFSGTTLYLTHEQYEAVGCPPLLAKLRLKVGVVK